MLFARGSIDLVLVPSSLTLMSVYHLLLLYRVLYRPHLTAVGYENHNKRAWADRIMRSSKSDKTNLGMTVITSSISASSNMASLCIALSSLIGTWAGSTSKVFATTAVYGDTSQSTSSVKYIALLVSFLAAFTFFIQSSRHLVLASYLMTIVDSDMPVEYAQRAVVRGGNFWALGLRAMYFATVLLMWIFGPIPMFLTSVCMVVMLHFLDSNSLPLHHHGFRDRAEVGKGRAEKGVGRTPEIGPFAGSPAALSASTILVAS